MPPPRAAERSVERTAVKPGFARVDSSRWAVLSTAARAAPSSHPAVRWGATTAARTVLAPPATPRSARRTIAVPAARTTLNPLAARWGATTAARTVPVLPASTLSASRAIAVPAARSTLSPLAARWGATTAARPVLALPVSLHSAGRATAVPAARARLNLLAARWGATTAARPVLAQLATGRSETPVTATPAAKRPRPSRPAAPTRTGSAKRSWVRLWSSAGEIAAIDATSRNASRTETDATAHPSAGRWIARTSCPRISPRA
jgi:hypothetical protein